MDNTIKVRIVQEMLRILNENRDTIVRRAGIPKGCAVFHENDREYHENLEIGYVAFDNLFDHVQEKAEAYYPKEGNHGG